jgi:uncharacterized membrane protein YdfJ with MMPL/SSD domain
VSRLAALVQTRARTVIGATALIFVAAVVFGGPVVGILQTSLSDFEDSSSQTATATRLIRHATGAQDEVGVVALVRGGEDVRTGLRARQAQATVRKLLATQRGYVGAIDYANSRDPELISLDRREALVLATFKTRKLAWAAVEHVRRRVRAQQVKFGGLDIVFEELTRRSRSDLARAELIVLPLLILLSLWIFRGVVAALLPLLVGALTILGTFLCLRVVDQALGISVFALNLVSALGLGLAIDYSLFVLARYREELARADAPNGAPGLEGSVGAGGGSASGRTGAAIERTLQTAGRTVLFSALTVAAAMASLTVFPLPFLYSMGIAGVFTALLAGVTSLVVLPAILFALGGRVNALAPRWLQRSSARAARPEISGFWSRLARGVMRRPGAIALASGALLLAAGSPVLGMGLTPASSSLLPRSAQARQVDEAIKRNFAANPALPIADVVQAPPSEVQGVVAYARQVAAASGEASRVRLLYLSHSTWLIAVPPRGDPFSTSNEALVRRLRALHAPYPSAVGGITAWYADQIASLGSHLPFAALIVALTMFATIFVMTGSAVLPLKTLLMNLLTLSVATGALVVGFQEGALGGILGFRANGGLEPSNLVLLFTVAFALASDYGVFLLARIKEAHDSGLSNRDAVAVGLERTGRLVTAAALLFCVAVGALVSSSVLSIKELGFGAALAVAVDASIVRALLVPSLMALLGRWNWWSPAPLRRLHARIAIHEGAPVEPRASVREPVA